jgi:uncharacterized protein involved in exopolysaccharide biosynthesis
LAGNYDQIIAERQRELQRLLDLSSEYDALGSTVDQAGATYSYLLDRETEAKLKENELSNVDFIRVIPARERSHPLPRVNLKVILLGLVVSLVLGIMLAFLLEYLEVAEGTPGEHEMVEKPPDSAHSEFQAPLPVGRRAGKGTVS